MTSKTYCIYGLIDPETSEIRYIGKTENMRSRILSHRRNKNKSNSRKREWIQGIHDRGQVLDYVILQVSDTFRLKMHEAQWYSFFINQGVDLLNSPTGIRGGKALVEAVQASQLTGETKHEK